jgi:hypothetical protein
MYMAPAPRNFHLIDVEKLTGHVAGELLVYRRVPLSGHNPSDPALGPRIPV